MTRHTFPTLLLLAAMAAVPSAGAFGRRLSIDRYHARAGGGVPCTEAINRAIADAAAGDTVVVPAGRWRTGTIHLKSHMTLLIEPGAELVADADTEGYGHYTPARDMSRYDTGAGTRNANLTGDARWTRALILGQRVEDVTITGGGTVDGTHLEDPLGEEGLRGPHTLLLAESRNVTVEGVRFVRAANYAILGYALRDCIFQHLSIQEGWDGIHIRGGEHITIADCDIATGDDAVAGGYWQGMSIENCRLNSSCNGLRIIEPSQHVVVSHCHIGGPGRFPHRTRLERPIPSPPPAGHDLIYGIVIEPGAWGAAPGRTDSITVRNVTIENSWAPVAYSMGEGNTCGTLVLDHVEATGIRGVAQPINRQDCVESWENIILHSVHVGK